MQTCPKCNNEFATSSDDDVCGWCRAEEPQGCIRCGQNVNLKYSTGLCSDCQWEMSQ